MLVHIIHPSRHVTALMKNVDNKIKHVYIININNMMNVFPKLSVLKIHTFCGNLIFVFVSHFDVFRRIFCRSR